MSGKGLALTDRDRAVVREVARFGVMTRQQLVRLGLFSSKTRANERLKRLVDAGHLAAKRQPIPVGGPRQLYFPSRSAPDGSRRRLDASDVFLAHQLGLVDVRLAFEQYTELVRWLSDKDLADLSLGLVPDAYVEFEVGALMYCAFVEYDRGTETSGRVERKVRAYVDLARSGRFERTFGRRFFRLLLVTDSPGRLTTLSRAVLHITDRIVRITTLSKLSEKGPNAAIWLRPGAQVQESLTNS